MQPGDKRAAADIHLLRLDPIPIHILIALRRGNNSHKGHVCRFRGRVLPAVHQSEHLSCHTPYPAHQLDKILPGVQAGQLRPGQPCVGGLKEYHRVGAVDQRDRQVPVPWNMEQIDLIPRGEQLSGQPAPGPLKGQPHRRTAPGHAADHGIPLGTALSVLHLYPAGDHPAGIGIINPHHGLRLPGFHHTLVNRKGPNGRGHVSAVPPVVHIIIFRIYLEKIVIHICLRPLMGGDHRHLVGGEIHAHGGEPRRRLPNAQCLGKQLRPDGFVLRQILLLEKQRPAGAAADIRTRYFSHIIVSSQRTGLHFLQVTVHSVPGNTLSDAREP